MEFAEIIVPLPLNAVFTYAIPEKFRKDVSIGSRVLVPFGRRKFYTGIVESLTPIAPQGVEIRPITRLIDKPGDPILRNPQLRFWRWLSDYYMCSIGEVMRAALPSALKLESETFIEPTSDADRENIEGLTEDEALMYAVLCNEGKVSLGDLSKKTGLTAAPDRAISGLIGRGLAMVSEKVVERYRTLKKTYVSLSPDASSQGWRTSAFALIGRSPKQEKLLLTMLHFHSLGEQEVEKSVLLEKADVSPAIIKALEAKGILTITTKVINRFAPQQGSIPAALPTLSPAQTEARNKLLDLWETEGKQVNLLRGVTSSGKTEIYIHLIDRVLRAGHQVLFLVPEIALTTQLTERLQRVFGSKVLVYHSKFTDNERVDIWNRLLHSREPMVIIGARSSVFLPFSHLGLIVIDEEHEPSFKQFDPAPRYNGRDSAIMLAGMHGAKVLLGSASPSVETYYKAQSGRYGLVELTERFGGVELPTIEIVDMKKEWKKFRTDKPLAEDVEQKISAAVSAGNQAIVFHNRRGFAPLARCKACAHVPKCLNCDVSLTYHRRDDKLVCHYCGAQYPLPALCPVCNEPAMEIIGYGTERIEDEVGKEFPEARILRMDLDTTRNKDGYQEIINDFSQHKADILVGTQMVTKGLDFSDVSIVAVLNADMLINIPDFRSSERAFNMLLQVAGRAGRRETSGKVIVQTSQPEHPVIGFLTNHDYTGFYVHELAERRERFYPPFSRMIFIYLKHREEHNVDLMAERYGNELRALLGDRVSGPEKPAVARVQSLYIRRFMLKIEPEASMAKVRTVLRDLYDRMLSAYPDLRGVTIHYDVDPA